MEYSKLLKSQKGCPFCILKKEEIIKKNRFACLILARAPYEEGHLLIISRRHVSNIEELGRIEKIALFRLLLWAEKRVKREYNNYSILYREGKKMEVGKSIEHFHIHIIPNTRIASTKNYNSAREAFDDKEYIEKTKGIKNRLK